MTKVQSHVMLGLHNVSVVSSNVRKNKKTIKCDKSIIICDVNTAQYEDSIIKCEKKIKEQSNVTKVQSYVILLLHNMKIVASNMRENNGIIEYDKIIIICDIIITQYKNSVIKM